MEKTRMATKSRKDLVSSNDTFDVQAFRTALGAFITGVTIVTTLDNGGKPRGFTANSFTSVSLDPPLVLVCIAKGGASQDVFCSARHFAIHVLAESQKSLSSLFASKVSDRFDGIGWSPGSAGDPILDGVAAWFECDMHQQIDSGDHVILIGQVTRFCSNFSSPLGYCRGAYVAFSLSQNALAANSPRTRVGAILESDGKVVLFESPDGTLNLPSGSRLGTPGDADSLMGRLQHRGLSAKLSFLFSVFEDQRSVDGCLSVYYRGNVVDATFRDRSVMMIPFETTPWDLIPDADERSMLRRFVKERQENTYEVFAGTTESGTFHVLQ
jgi:flavin reductase (DIM6/NTAB) family NADH-FMN oxidoreductase RutF